MSKLIILPESKECKCRSQAGSGELLCATQSSCCSQVTEVEAGLSEAVGSHCTLKAWVEEEVDHLKVSIVHYSSNLKLSPFQTIIYLMLRFSQVIETLAKIGPDMI